MSVYGWIAVSVLFLIILLVVVKMFVATPGSKQGKHFLALTPIILGLLFVLLMPSDALYVSESVSTFTRTIIPFVSIAFALPLIYKANKEINESE